MRCPITLRSPAGCWGVLCAFCTLDIAKCARKNCALPHRIAVKSRSWRFIGTKTPLHDFMDYIENALTEIKAWETETPGVLNQVADFMLRPAEKAAEAIIPAGVSEKLVRPYSHACLHSLPRLHEHSIKRRFEPQSKHRHANSSRQIIPRWSISCKPQTNVRGRYGTGTLAMPLQRES